MAAPTAVVSAAPPPLVDFLGPQVTVDPFWHAAFASQPPLLGDPLTPAFVGAPPSQTASTSHGQSGTNPGQAGGVSADAPAPAPEEGEVEVVQSAKAKPSRKA